jgi:hypothetical protein
MTNARSFKSQEASPGKPSYETAAVELAERDNRDSQREAVLRVMVPLLTALPKARLTALI